MNTKTHTITLTNASSIQIKHFINIEVANINDVGDNKVIRGSFANKKVVVDGTIEIKQINTPKCKTALTHTKRQRVIVQNNL